MRRAPVIVDTNIVVAGLLSRNTASPVVIILDGMLKAAFSFVLSEPLLAEYRNVIGRPHLRKLHGLTMPEIDLILTDIAQHATVLKPGPGPQSPDPGDQMLWDSLASRPDLGLVTGDKLLLADLTMTGRVMSAKAFAESA